MKTFQHKLSIHCDNVILFHVTVVTVWELHPNSLVGCCDNDNVKLIMGHVRDMADVCMSSNSVF